MTTHTIPLVTKIQNVLFAGVLRPNYRNFSRLMLNYLTIIRIKQLSYDIIQ